MKTLKMVQKFEGIKKIFEEQKLEYSVNQVWVNLINLTINKKYERGMDLAGMRMASKVLDKLEEKKESVELSDEQFDFLYKLFNETSNLPFSQAIIEIADYLDEVKLQKEETQTTK